MTVYRPLALFTVGAVLGASGISALAAQTTPAPVPCSTAASGVHGGATLAGSRDSGPAR